MSSQVKNVAVILLAVVAVAAWGLVARQEIERRRLPKRRPERRPEPVEGPVEGSLPPDGTIKLPAPGSGPTEETPAVEIFGTITDAETGQPVVADVQACPRAKRRTCNVHIDDARLLADVTEFRLLFPAGDEAITITVTAPGYQKWRVDIKPHTKRSKKIDAPIKLKRRPEASSEPDERPDEGPVRDQA